MPPTKVQSDDEEDDYENMTFADPEPVKETSIQRRARLKREAEIRSRPRPKAEIEAEEAAAREAALATQIDKSNKGFKLMAKMGFKGGALGKEGFQGRTEPISLSMKDDRGGIGMDSEKKRKFREEMEKREIETKKAKVDEGDYRERMRLEREEKRMEGQIIGAMKVAERLSDGNKEGTESGKAAQETATTTTPGEVGEPEVADAPIPPDSAATKRRPLHSINVLWRGLERHRLEKDRDRRMRYELQQSLSRLPTYDDPDEDQHYKHALGKEEEELEEEDPELDEFNALEPAVRLGKLVDYLRQQHNYCFWCKFQYPDDKMEDCPGVTEDDHD